MTEDPNNPKVLASVRTEAEAVSIATALSDYDITARVTGDFTSGFKAEAPGYVQVLVRKIDFDRAKQALAEIHKEIDDIDWSSVDVGQPDEPTEG